MKVNHMGNQRMKKNNLLTREIYLDFYNTKDPYSYQTNEPFPLQNSLKWYEFSVHDGVRALSRTKDKFMQNQTQKNCEDAQVKVTNHR